MTPVPLYENKKLKHVIQDGCRSGDEVDKHCILFTYFNITDDVGTEFKLKEDSGRVQAVEVSEASASDIGPLVLRSNKVGQIE